MAITKKNENPTVPNAASPASTDRIEVSVMSTTEWRRGCITSLWRNLRDLGGDAVHQRGVPLDLGVPAGLAAAFQLQGSELSYTNWLDADAAWRLNRVSALEHNLLMCGVVHEDLWFHETTYQMREALGVANTLDRHAKALATLSLHGQRLSRQFEKTLALLKRLQAERFPDEQYQLNQAANLVQMHELEGEPYDPASDPGADGFVFSNEEIQEILRLRDRDQRAEGAAAYLADDDEDEYDD